MPGSDGNAAEVTPPLKVRAVEGHSERRQRSRRRWSRFGSERRRGDRRRQTLRTVLLAAAAISAAPTAMKAQNRSFPDLRPNVSVSIGNVVPLNAPPATAEAPYAELIAEAAAQYGLDAALLRAVMKTESAFDPGAVSPVGAMGLMQLMPALAKEMGVTNPFDPRENIMAGAKYLSRLLEAHRGNVALTLASYNAGPGNVRKYKGIPPFEETRNYVKKITDILETAE
jgi:soluble lytic murein transglycosylase-like protein